MTETTVPASTDTATPVRRGLGRDYTNLLTAYSVQTLGEGVLIAALPLLAARLTSRPLLISWVGLAQELPWLLLALPGGMIIDRYNRRRLMVSAQAVQAVMLLLVAVLATFHLVSIWLLYVVAFALGCGDVIFTGANRAVIPLIVDRDKLESANGRSVTAETVGRQFLGPPLGSALFAFLLPLPFWLDALTYLASLLLIARIRGCAQRFDPPRPDPAAPPRSRWAEATEGMRFLLGHRVLRAVIILAAVSNFGLFMAQSVLVLFAAKVLGVGNEGYGLLVAAMAIGGVLGGLFSRRIVDRFGPRRLVILVPITSALSLLSIGFFGHQPVVVVALFFIRSANLALWNVMAQSLSQRLVPNELRGRTITAGRMIAFGALPLGALAGGATATLWGLNAPWIVGGAVHLITALLFLPALSRWPASTPTPTHD
jgi:predicted MFS family arabinose efflux permease